MSGNSFVPRSGNGLCAVKEHSLPCERSAAERELPITGVATGDWELS